MLETGRKHAKERANRESRSQFSAQLQSQAGILFAILRTLRAGRGQVIEIEPFPCVFDSKWGSGGATGSTPAPWPLCRTRGHVDKVCKVEPLVGSTEVLKHATTGRRGQRR